MTTHRTAAMVVAMLLQPALAAPAGAADALAVTGHERGEETAILALIDRFMTAISTNDLQAMAALQMPDGMTYRARPAESGGIEVVAAPSSHWVQPERADGRVRLERYWSPTVLVRGHIALVWAPYEFWLDGKRSHCGVDTFDLVKTGDGWRVANAMWTVEPDGCESLGMPEPSQMRPAR